VSRPDARRDRTGPERHRYGAARSHYGELFLPPEHGPSARGRGGAPPVAVVLHGGFWKAQYGRRLMHDVCRDLAARGWAAWNLEYRRLGLGCGGGWPATFADVAAGVDRLAELDGLDLTRVVAVGHSAGGHLAAWAAARPRLPDGAPGAAPRVRVTAVAAQAGVVDLELAWELRLSRGVVRRLLGGTPEEHPQRYAAASPAALLPLGVPILLTHGARDDIVPPMMSERFAAAARERGDACELQVEAGEDHFGHLDPANPLWKAVVKWLT
jgi:acetyl esterase/lipase